MAVPLASRGRRRAGRVLRGVRRSCTPMKRNVKHARLKSSLGTFLDTPQFRPPPPPSALVMYSTFHSLLPPPPYPCFSPGLRLIPVSFVPSVLRDPARTPAPCAVPLPSPGGPPVVVSLQKGNIPFSAGIACHELSCLRVVLRPSFPPSPRPPLAAAHARGDLPLFRLSILAPSTGDMMLIPLQVWRLRQAALVNNSFPIPLYFSRVNN